MALADRHLARDPGPAVSERPAGGVTGPDSALAQGGAAAAPGAAWLAAAHCPIVTRTGSAGPGLPDSDSPVSVRP